MRGVAAAFIIALFTSTTAGAADFVLTERTAVERAVEQNLSLSSSRVLLEAKQIVSDTAWGSLVPGLSLSGALTRSNASAAVPAPGVPYSWSGSLSLGASASISAAALQSVRTARLDYAAGRVSFEEAQNAVTHQVRIAFYQLILLESQLGVSRASIATAEQTLEQVRTDHANGRVQRMTLRQAELAVQSAQLVLRRQTVQYENAMASFKDLLGIDQAKSVAVSGNLEVAPISAGPAVETSVAERADVRSISAQIALQESRNRAAVLDIVSPTLTVSASIAPLFLDPLNPNNPPGSGWNDRGSVSLSLSANSLLAFLPFVPQRVSLRGAEKSLQSLEIQKQGLVAAARTEIESLARSLDASAAAIESLKASVSLAQESYDLTREAYGLGTVDFLTLKSAEDDLLQARYDLLSEEYTYLTTLISLEYATGRDFRGRKE